MRLLPVCAIAGALACALGAAVTRAEEVLKVSVDWNNTLAVSKAVPSMQVIPNARSRRGGPLHDVTFSAIEDLDAKYVRFLPWGPYPHLQIAALYAPTPEKTSWDFTHIDPQMIDFLEATRGRESMFNFGSMHAMPAWMFKRTEPRAYTDDADRMDWGCGERSAGRPQLVDPSGRQLAEYYARMVSWYTQGGFTDENGRYHHSGHKYELPWWGPLNEMDLSFDPQQYTILYDAIVTAIRKVSPKTRFLGLEWVATAIPGLATPDFLEYFLNPKNHQPGIPVDMIAYHFYAYGMADRAPLTDIWQYSFFDQADTFLAQVRFAEGIRKHLSPATQVYPSEIGSMLPEDGSACEPGEPKPKSVPAGYWNLSAALYAYLYAELAKLGVDVVGQAGFSFYPGNFAGVSMVNWTTGKLNARYHVLKLIKDHFGAGDKLVSTGLSTIGFRAEVAAQAFDTSAGRKILLINKRSRPVEVELDSAGRLARLEIVDERSGEGPARQLVPSSKRVRLEPFAVAVAILEEK